MLVSLLINLLQYSNVHVGKNLNTGQIPKHIYNNILNVGQEHWIIMKKKKINLEKPNKDGHWRFSYTHDHKPVIRPVIWKKKDLVRKEFT